MAGFNVGDVVRLKSGGPQMTVSKIESSDRVICTWHDGTKYDWAAFEVAILELEG